MYERLWRGGNHSIHARVKQMLNLEEFEHLDLSKFGLFGKSYSLSKTIPSFEELCRFCMLEDGLSNKLLQLIENNMEIYEFKKFKQEYPELADRYNIQVRKLDDTDMPYNSDHAPFVYNIDEDESDGKQYGRAVVCYGSGSMEYHTYLDNMDRFNEESLAVSGIIYGSLVYYLAYGD